MKLFERRIGKGLWRPERLPPTLGVGVIVVDSFDPDIRGLVVPQPMLLLHDRQESNHFNLDRMKYFADHRRALSVRVTHREDGYCSSTLTSSKTAVATTAELWLVTIRLLLDGDIARVTVPTVTHVTPSLDAWPV